MCRVRQQHQIARWNGDLGAQPRALTPQGVFDHLHRQHLTGGQQLCNRRPRLARGQLTHRGELIVVWWCARWFTAHQIGNVQKRGAGQTNVHKRRLHARQDALDPAHVDLTHTTGQIAPFNGQFLGQSIFDNRHTTLGRRDIDQDLITQTGILLAGDFKRILSMPISRMPQPSAAQQLAGLVQRQAHDIGVTAFNSRHKQARLVLDGVATGLIHGVLAVDVALDPIGGQ